VPVPRSESFLGIGIYATKTSGIGGMIRASIDDFLVEEVLVDGSIAKIEKNNQSRALRASLFKQRYLLCVLVKHNWDTLIAIRKIAQKLGISQRKIQIAGIKDAKAVTAQHITIENGSIEETSKVIAKDIEIRPLGYFRDKLSPYYLLGNSFALRIKRIVCSESAIEKRIIEIHHELDAIGGIPNFFGHQRFGTIRPITHLVGKAIIEGDIEKAAMLFLAKSSAHEHPYSREVREQLNSTQNFKQALLNFPKQLRFERTMLNHLATNTKDFIGAFKRLPLRLQRLFVQAFQSFLFNRFLSERIKRGYSFNKAEVGDYLVVVDRAGLPIVNAAKVADSDSVTEYNKLIKTGRMQVALPLIGTKQRLSKGTMGQVERQILMEEGIQPEQFRISAIPEVSQRGWLRAILAPVQNFRLNDISGSSSECKEHQAELSFMLLRGSYATVLLRELMKPKYPIKAGF
jgi:tRNA pseudouridine13 synthase